MSTDSSPRSGGVRPLVALGLATAAFVALLVGGFGVASLVLDRDVITVRGLGQVPGIAGTALATGVFAGSLWLVLRRDSPSYRAGALCAPLVALAYPTGVAVAALAGGAGLGEALGAAGSVLLSWFGVVLAAAAFVSAWGAIALVRTDAQRPRWPWEDPFDE